MAHGRYMYGAQWRLRGGPASTLGGGARNQPTSPTLHLHAHTHSSPPTPPRLLKLEVSELQRSIEVTKARVPAVPLLDTDVARLQKQLFEARREAEQLSLSLEDPSNTTR